MTITPFISLFFFILLFIYSFNYYSKKISFLKISHIYILLLIHTMFSVTYYYYSLSNLADANLYYLRDYNFDNLLKLNRIPISSEFMVFFIRFFDLSYFHIIAPGLIFSTIGFIAILNITSIFRIYRPFNIKKLILPIIFILSPGINFWSSWITKEVFIFLGTSFMITSLIKLSEKFTYRNVIILLLSLSLLLLIRPFWGLFIIIILFFSSFFYFVYVTKDKLFILFIYFLLSICIIFLINIIPSIYIPEYKIEKLSIFNYQTFEYIYNYIYKRTSLESTGTLSYSYLNINFITKIFMFLSAPLKFDQLFYLILTLDNIILLLLFIYLIYNLFSKKILIEILNNFFIFFFIILLFIGLIFLASVTNNAGIAIRYKLSITPLLFVIIFYMNNYKYKVNE